MAESPDFYDAVDWVAEKVKLKKKEEELRKREKALTEKCSELERKKRALRREQSTTKSCWRLEREFWG